MNTLGVDNEGTEDDDDESSDGWEEPMRVFAITECPPKEQVATRNRSEALASESEDRDEPNNLECPNRFAHNFQHGKKLSQTKKDESSQVREHQIGTGHAQGKTLYACAAD